jgi:hypothetical protein
MFTNNGFYLWHMGVYFYLIVIKIVDDSRVTLSFYEYNHFSLYIMSQRCYHNWPLLIYYFFKLYILINIIKSILKSWKCIYKLGGRKREG